ncbi:MAG: hypothetical protein J6P98_08580, partial [Clostridia bacterium]|nr:hypothetical protein [Clostridia bacterium]
MEDIKNNGMESTRVFAVTVPEPGSVPAVPAAQPENEEPERKGLFKRRKTARPFLLSVLFDVLKVVALAVLLIGVAGFGLVMGVAKAYVDTTPELD